VSGTASLGGPAVPRPVARRVDEACDRFEKAWRAGQKPCLEDALADAACAERSLLFRELLAVEVELRRGRGEVPAPADYLPRFPGWAEQIGAVLEAGPAAALALSNYDVLAELGRGGMGVVYLARQRRPDRVVALKVVRIDHLRGLPAEDGARCIERFRREAEAAGRLEHEHLVPVYEAGESGGLLYYSMRYVEGRGLHELIQAGPLPGPEAAALLEPVARAAHFAHQHGVLHRDLKPHNIVVEARTGKPFVMDFGLAKVLEGAGALTGTRELVGTPFYMAPEQINAPARVGPAADVYGLGATLYHALTGRPPFQAASVAATVHQVVHEQPLPPRRLNPSVDAPLETIALKCLAKEPERRYASAEALADDLGRYRQGRPILARPAGRLERCRLWCRRNPAKATLLAGLAVSVAGLVAAAVWGYAENRAWAEAQARAADESRAREVGQKREALLQSLQAQLHDSDRTQGWSERAWGLVRQAAALGDDDGRLGYLAGCTLAGLDARPVSGLGAVTQGKASSLAFDACGRLLLGGTADAQGKPLTAARLWDGSGGRLRLSRQSGDGPVAFQAAERRPVQLLARPGPYLLLWDLSRQRPLAECRFGAGSRARAVARNDQRRTVTALSADGSAAAAAAEGGVVGVWETQTGRLLLEQPGSASALALSARGDLLAVVGTDGTVAVWSVPAGQRLASFPGPRVRAHCLAFSPDSRRLDAGGPAALRGSLALGDASGLVTIWDLSDRVCQAFCRGGPYDVFAVAFSPDGTLLAAGGRGPVRIYEAPTGRFLLAVEGGDYVAALAFSPDGRRLAGSSEEVPGRVCVWQLEPGRGMQTLRGLSSHVTRLCLSADGKRLAALADTWRVGVWDLETGRLLRLLKVAQGITADNAALAFSNNGRRLAFSAGREARLWDLNDGRLLARWSLPRGLIDRLAFDAAGNLGLYRMEYKDDPGPGGDLDYRRHPRLYRARRLTAPDRTAELFTIERFNERIYTALLAPDGSALVLDGRRTDAGGSHRAITAFDGLRGKEHWSLRSPKQGPSAFLLFDPAGRVVVVDLSHDDRDRCGFVDLASGRVVQEFRLVLHGLGPRASYLVRHGTDPRCRFVRGFSLVPAGHDAPAITLGPDDPVAATLAVSSDGARWAWGNTGGTITVADLGEINERLTRVGLGW
jgi:WD40 repeat protein/predicted Ser/Thr protein kinase